MSVVLVSSKGFPKVICSAQRDPATAKVVLPETQTALYENRGYLGLGASVTRCKGEEELGVARASLSPPLASGHQNRGWVALMTFCLTNEDGNWRR